MKVTIGNTSITFHTDFCRAENQEENDKARLKRIAQRAQLALAATEQSGQAVC